MAYTIQTVAHVTREYGDLIGLGGIKDSVAGLCRATARAGIATHVFVPGPVDPMALTRLTLQSAPLQFAVPLRYHARYERSEEVVVSSYAVPDQANLFLHVVAAQRFAFLAEGSVPIPRRGIYTYTAEEAGALQRPNLLGQAYADAFEMDILLIKATLGALAHLGLHPDLLRCHDGHTAALPLIAQHSVENFAGYLADVPTLITIHNASDWYRGEVAYSDFIAAVCGVPAYVLDICVHNGKFDPLLAGAIFGTRIHTVSENYAREMQETGMDWLNSWLGHKLAGYGIKLTGITHGIDATAFSPEEPACRGLPAAFAPRTGDFAGKRTCKRALLQAVGFDAALEDLPLLTFAGRIVYQKGLHILAPAILELFAADAGVLLIGNGGGYKETVDDLRHKFGDRFKDRIYVAYEYQPALTNLILAAGDFCVIPSLFEPCGQVDFIAQLNGNLPIVHAVGGLVKVEHGVTGFCYRGRAPELLTVLREALHVYRTDQPRLRQMQVAAARRVVDGFSWDQVFRTKYLPLYHEVIAQAQPRYP